MAHVATQYKVVGQGVGAPDYSDTVSSGITRAGIRLKANQYLKLFGRSLNIAEPAYGVPDTHLAAGADTHLTDFETLGPMPYTVPADYTLRIKQIGYTVTQDMMLVAYIDGSNWINCLGAVASGIPFYEDRVVGLSTSWVDPTGALAHDVDIKLYNRGGGDLYGGVVVSCVLEAVGTPPLPTEKDCHCPQCAHIQRVSVHSTRIQCENCDRVYFVLDLSRVREA